MQIEARTGCKLLGLTRRGGDNWMNIVATVEEKLNKVKSWLPI
jgi:hypothetical protein